MDPQMPRITPPVDRVPCCDEHQGSDWHWLDGAPLLRKLEDAFPLRCYLNLARREDRRTEAEYQFAQQGLAVERMAAVNGRTARSMRGYATAGAYGCAMSHRLLLRRAKME